MTARDRLDAIEAALTHDEDTADLVAFARAVLDLHAPDKHGRGMCDEPGCVQGCEECKDDWPCATVRLATEHLTNGDDDDE